MVAVREICLGFDVGKATHQACAVCRTTGKVLLNDPLDNKEDSIDKMLGSARFLVRLFFAPFRS